MGFFAAGFLTAGFFTGGFFTTGRFADATGHFVIHSIFNLVDMKIVQSSIMPGGSISY